MGFGEFSRRASRALLDLLHRAGLERGVVVDLGCGSGRWLRELAGAGYEPVGVDTSSALLAIARRTAPGAKLDNRSVYDFAFPDCVAVTALGEVLGYVPPGKVAPSLPRLFRRVASALRPGGLFVFDLVVRSARRPMCYRSWTLGEDWAALVDVSEDPARSRLERRIITFRRIGDRYRRAEERHRVRVAAREEIERALRLAGFSVRVSRRYGELELPRGRLAFVARLR